MSSFVLFLVQFDWKADIFLSRAAEFYLEMSNETSAELLNY